jgi:hypothetical protein
MADLLTSERAADDSAAGALRPLAVGAAVGGLVASVSVLLACLAVAIGGWFASGAAEQASTADALRVGADAWLLGLGAHLDLADAHVTVVPLGLSLVSAWVCYRTGRWARRGVAAPDVGTGWLAAVVMAVVYGAVAAVIATTASTEAAHPHPILAFAGGFVLAFLSGGAGLMSDPERPWRARLPEPVAATATGALGAVLVTVAVCALVLAVALLHGFGAAANVLSGLGVDPVGALLYTVVISCVAPNAVLLTGSYLLGAGFSVGVGTVVSPTAVSLGPVPAFPLLAALPDDGPTPDWEPLLMGLPVLAAAAAAVLALRRHPVRRYDLGALRGLAGGLGGGVLLALLASLAGGSVGPGRMSEVGVGLGHVLPLAVLSLAVGGVIGGLVGTWLVRRRA